MSQLRRRLAQWFRWVALGAFVASGLATIAVLVAVTVDIVGRGAFNAPLQGSTELVALLMIAIVMLGAPQTSLLGAHIRISVLTDRLGKGSQAVLAVVASVLGAVVLGLMAWTGVSMTIDSWRSGDYAMGSIHWPMWPFWVCFVVGAVLFCIERLSSAFCQIRSLAGGAPK